MKLAKGYKGGKSTNHSQVHLLEAKLSKERTKKASLEQKIQAALSHRRSKSPNSSSARSGSKLSAAKSHGEIKTSPRQKQRMYRHPREMEESLLQSEADFQDLQSKVDYLETVVRHTKEELGRKKDALKNSELKVETLVSLLNDLMSRLLKKETGVKLTNSAVARQLWETPVNMHFCDNSNIDDFIDAKLERIASTLGEGHTAEHSRSSNGRLHKVPEEKALLLWNDVTTVAGQSMDTILKLSEFQVHVKRVCLNDDICRRLQGAVNAFIPNSSSDDVVFGKDEFIAFIEHSTDAILLSWLSAYESV
jgi:hypothetical protein